MKRYLLTATALLYAAFLAWGCASVHESVRNTALLDCTSEEFYNLWPLEADSTEVQP